MSDARPDWWPVLVASVKQHEGRRLRLYTDTEGKLSIGYGRNLSDNGITADEAEQMLAHDLDVAYRESLAAWPWLRTQTAGRQAVVVEMALNMGVTRLRGFGRFLEALRMGRYGEAAQEMLDSKWATQVKGRALTLAERMRRG